MTPEEVTREVRRLEITTRHLVRDIVAGEYSSAFRGRGVEFAEVREYQPGDDIRAIFFIRDPNRAQLVEIAGLVDAGKLQPQVGAVYPLADAREAFVAKSGGGVPGRVLLQP